jgi:predicted component of type VI protein secretion system
MAKLVVLTEGFTGKTVELTADRLRIGRLDDNPFSIPEPSISSHHCEVWLKGDDLVVKDLNSTNGTFLNESQLKSEKEGTLKPGQILRLGGVEIRYETGKKQLDQPRHTVRLGADTNTMVMAKGAGFAKKSNKVNRIFIGVGIFFGVVIFVALIFVFINLDSGRP